MQSNIDWSSLSKETLQQEASNYQYDHDNGSECFFEASRAEWVYQLMDPFLLNIFKNSETAKKWLENEIAILVNDKQHSRAIHYQNMLLNGFSEPITVGRFKEDFGLWDGYHRLAISIIRKEFIPAIIGTCI